MRSERVRARPLGDSVRSRAADGVHACSQPRRGWQRRAQVRLYTEYLLVRVKGLRRQVLNQLPGRQGGGGRVRSLLERFQPTHPGRKPPASKQRCGAAVHIVGSIGALVLFPCPPLGRAGVVFNIRQWGF